ncbi:MAG: hypothetical protein AABX68_00805 [Nanoarchaeota archaeon]
MKKENKESGDYEIKFWKDWLESDSLKRVDLVEKLPIIEEISHIGKFPEKIRMRSFALMLNSFFEDLESAVYTKIRLKKKK